MTVQLMSWFSENMSNPIFTHADVLELGDARLTSDTVQNWANRGLTKPDLVGGKRRYNTFELMKVCLTQPLVLDLGITPSVAILSVAQAFLLVTVNLVDTKKAKAKKDSIPFDQIQHFVAVYGRTDETPRVADGRKLPPDLFADARAYVVLPFGRMLMDLAAKAKALVDSRQGLSGGAASADEVPSQLAARDRK